MLKYSSYQSIYHVPSSQSRTSMNRSNLKKLHIYRRWWQVVLITILLMLVCTVAVKAFEVGAESEPKVATEAVIIQSGDTLWQIAAQYKPEGWDTRAFIQAIQMANEMDNSVIRAGEIILIPMLD